jgi:hypothetical protein
LEIVSIRVSSTQKAMPSGCLAMRRLSRRTQPDRSPWRPLPRPRRQRPGLRRRSRLR